MPADPLTGFVDRPRDVEANLPKERQPLAYALALVGGGAKDVTSRCAFGGQQSVVGLWADAACWFFVCVWVVG